MAIELYNDGNHRCIKFDDLTKEGEIPANQFMIVHDKRGLLIDPGGNKLFAQLSTEIAIYAPPQRVDYIVLSHQDPDVGAGLNGWLLMTDAKIVISALWTRFIPNFCTSSFAENRMVAVPDEGMDIELSGAPLKLVPAHFLHSPGNFHLYDATSRILFTGDLGASIAPPEENVTSAQQFKEHIDNMSGFHARYIPHSEACRRWAKEARKLDIDMIVPQHGARMSGSECVNAFIDWVDGLTCALG